jgi:hypothetical protein
MATHPDARRKDVLEQIAHRAMQKYGFLPDFSAEVLKELETVQQADREAESPKIDRATCSEHPLTAMIPWTWTN